jgi:hypothetical protein
MPEKNEIADNYEIIEQIAETHKSIVYRAKDKTNQQIVISKRNILLFGNWPKFAKKTNLFKV